MDLSPFALDGLADRPSLLFSEDEIDLLRDLSIQADRPLPPSWFRFAERDSLLIFATFAEHGVVHADGRLTDLGLAICEALDREVAHEIAQGQARAEMAELDALDAACRRRPRGPAAI